MAIDYNLKINKKVRNEIRLEIPNELKEQIRSHMKDIVGEEILTLTREAIRTQVSGIITEELERYFKYKFKEETVKNLFFDACSKISIEFTNSVKTNPDSIYETLFVPAVNLAVQEIRTNIIDYVKEVNIQPIVNRVIANEAQMILKERNHNA